MKKSHLRKAGGTSHRLVGAHSEEADVLDVRDLFEGDAGTEKESSLDVRSIYSGFRLRLSAGLLVRAWLLVGEIGVKSRVLISVNHQKKFARV